MAGILDSIKVITMEHYIGIPMSSVYLADWGADVIKVEPMTGEGSRGTTRVGGTRRFIKFGDVEVNAVDQSRDRNKRSLAIDLKKEAGRDILCQLVQKVDVFMSNYQLSSLTRLRLDYNTLRQLNPKLVYAYLTGYGSKGADKDEPAYYATAAWARSGMQYILSEPENPPTQSPAGMGDYNASAHIVAGICAALFHREKTGLGQELECSLFQTAIWSIHSEVQPVLCSIPWSKPDRTKAYNPLFNSYRTKDGRWLQLAMFQPDPFWSDFCRAIESPELENDPRFKTMELRGENCQELIRILDEAFATKTLEEWDRLCREYHFNYSRIQTLEEVVADPQALANDFFVDSPHPIRPIKVIASPVRFHQNPASVRTPAPELGQHTEEILLDLGYSWEDIASLKEQRVIP